jgi:hypothetical protein
MLWSEGLLHHRQGAPVNGLCLLIFAGDNQLLMASIYRSIDLIIGQ